MNLKGVILRLILSIEFFAIMPMILARITGMNFFYSLSEIITLVLSILVILASIILMIDKKRDTSSIEENIHSLTSEVVMLFVFASANNSIYFVGWTPFLLYLTSKFLVISLLVKLIKFQMKES